MEQTNRSTNTGTGYLTVQVTTAGGAIPLEGARINVRGYPEEEASAPEVRGDVIASLTSGRDGNTARIPLSAPPMYVAQKPGNGHPYALYQVEISREGYYDQAYIGIPIFDGITSVQPAILIPLPEDGTVATPRPQERRYFETPAGDL